MIKDAKIAVTIITVTDTTSGKRYALLGAQDPRWRLDNEGKFDGIPLLDAEGKFNQLPLHPGFLGGMVAKGEDPERAALRELREEGGHALSEAVRDAGLVKLGKARPDERWREQPVTQYFFADLVLPSHKIERLKEALKPGDDNLALMLVPLDDITRTENGAHILAKPPEFLRFRDRDYVKISTASGGSDVTIEAIKRCNAAGKKSPLIGIDTDSLNRKPTLFCPPETPADRCLSDEDITHALEDTAYIPHVSNGAMLEQLVQSGKVFDHIAATQKSREEARERWR